MWSSSSDYEQCRSCCYDATLVGNLPDRKLESVREPLHAVSGSGSRGEVA